MIELPDVNNPPAGPWLDPDSGVEGVRLPSGLKEIPDYCFYDCKSIKTVFIPKSVQRIGKYAFGNCTALEVIYYEGTKEEWDKIVKDENWDYNAGSSTSTGTYRIVYLGKYSGECGYNGSTVIWELNPETGVLWISGVGDMANYSLRSPAPWFKYNDKITCVVVANSVRYIGEYAFANCTSLKYAYIARSVKKIGNAAFYGCTALELILFEGTRDEYIKIPGRPEPGHGRRFIPGVPCPSQPVLPGDFPYDYRDGDNGGRIIIIRTGNNKKRMPSYHPWIPGFMPPWLKDGAPFFDGAEFQSGLEEIGDYAFYGCSSLKTVVIPASVKRIGAYAFAECVNLETIYFLGTKEQWDAIEKGEGWDRMPVRTRLKANIR